MAMKVKKEAPPSQSQNQSKALTDRTAVQEGIHPPERGRSACSPPSGGLRHCNSEEYPPGDASLTTVSSPSSCNPGVHHEGEKRQQHACVHGHFKVKKPQVEEAAKKSYDTDLTKVNALMLR